MAYLKIVTHIILFIKFFGSEKQLIMLKTLSEV